MLGRPSSLCADQLDVKRVRDAAGDLALQGGQITAVAIEPLRAQMRTSDTKNPEVWSRFFYP
jgi:hypothetical protein